jgi:hypothetical protein
VSLFGVLRAFAAFWLKPLALVNFLNFYLFKYLTFTFLPPTFVSSMVIKTNRQLDQAKAKTGSDKKGN